MGTIYSINSSPILYDISINNFCNGSCYYCYQKKSNVKKQINFSILSGLQNVVKISDKIRIFGGEPTLSEKHIFYICSIFPKNFKIIISNGIYFSDFLRSILKLFQDTVYIRISYDGYINDKTRGNTKSILENINWLANNNIDFSIYPMVPVGYERYLFEVIKSIYEIFKRYNIKKKLFFGLETDKLDKYDLSTFISEITKLYYWYKENDIDLPIFNSTMDMICGAGYNLFSIDVNGNVYPCNICFHTKSNCKKIGNILDFDIMDKIQKIKTTFNRYENILWTKSFLYCPFENFSKQNNFYNNVFKHIQKIRR